MRHPRFTSFWILMPIMATVISWSGKANTAPSMYLETQSDQINWCNLQWPAQANISPGGSVTVYVRCYQPGVTTLAGSDPSIQVWVGTSTENTNPITWTNWKPASFNTDYSGVDEYMVSLGTLSSGIYYYASRVQFNGGSYRYGGYHVEGGGFWDGINRISGILTVGKSLATVTLGNLVQPFSGAPRPVTVETNPQGLPVQVTYNGVAAVPSLPGTYSVMATVVHPDYQGNRKGILTVYSFPDDEASKELQNRFIWVKYDQVYNQGDLDTVLSFSPDVISRGWFRWGDWGDFNYGTWSWMAQQAAAKDAAFGGGETVQALYKEEADPVVFERIVERTPRNKPMYFQGDSTSGYYFGDIQKKEYLDYLLSWLYQQIDAGATTLHLDGITAVPALNTGYSDYSMGEFNKYLISKYVTNQGWTLSDSRWETVFDIDFSGDCTDGSIQTFDYRKYLIRNGFADNPPGFDFALRYEFGDPWHYTGTYSEERYRIACAYLYNSVKDYAALKGKQVSLTTNGFSDYVDYQTMGVWDSWSVSGGRLSIAPSYISHWRDIKKYSQEHLGKDIPLVVFHDWGNGMPFLGEIPESDQILWLRVYAPEVFASGGIFAWPLSGGGNLYRSSQAVRNTIRSLINWYTVNRNLYTDALWNEIHTADLNGMTEVETTILDLMSDENDVSKRVVHLINKKTDTGHALVPRSNFIISVPSETEPRSVWACSPDFSDFRKLEFTYSNLKAAITVNSLDAYTVVVLDYNGKVPQRIHFAELAARRPGTADFSPGASASSGLAVAYESDNPSVATIVNGKVHITGTGSCQIMASQSGNEDYEPAPPVSHLLTVSNATSLENTDKESVILRPNPTGGVIHLDNLTNCSAAVEIFDLSGVTRLNGQLKDGAFDVGTLEPGIYFLKQGSRVYRFIRE